MNWRSQTTWMGGRSDNVVKNRGPLMSYLEKSSGSAAGGIWIFSVARAVAFIFGWKVVPETKGKSMEEIAASWSRKPQPASH
jgi:hypothetical protein